jgi:FlaG protein
MSLNEGVGAFGKFLMDISLNQSGYSPPPAPAPPPLTPVEAVQHREVVGAARSINASGYLGQNQIVFVMDRGTHRAIMRIVDRVTNEVVLQLPPEYVLQLAKELKVASTLTSNSGADE